MTEFPLPPNEALRLQALYSYQILDTPAEQAFDDLTQIAAHICETPIALVSLIDEARQWFKAKVGIDADQTEREEAFCNYTICQAEVFIVPDALSDWRFATHPRVLGAPYVRFYAGTPLLTPEGYALGSLCVVDHVPRNLRPDQYAALQVLGRQVVTQLELRRNLANLSHITQELQQADLALRESERRFRTMANSSPVLMWMDDLNQHCIFHNQSWFDFTGRSVTQELGIGWTENIHPDDLQQWQQAYNRAFNARQPYEVEYRLLRHDGEYRWLLETGAPRYQPDGTFVGYTGSCLDITERRHAEAALRQSEELFCQLADHIREVFWVYSPQTKTLLYVSPAYETLWGYSCESLYTQPRSWLEAVTPEYREHLNNCFNAAQGFDEEFQIQRADGAIRWIRNQAFPVYNSGKVHRLVGIAEDITARKQIEQDKHLLQSMTNAIVESHDFHSALRVALQKVCEATHWDFGEAWTPRTDRTILECSPAWYSKEEKLVKFRQQSQSFSFEPGVGLPGRIWLSKRPEWCRDVSAQAESTYLRAQMALEAGLKASLGLPILAGNEVIAVLIFYMFEARDEDVRLIELISASTELGLFIQRKQTEEKIRQALDKERELSQLKSNFISIVSHEFRTPLTSIVMCAELLEKYGEQQSPEKKRENFDRIRKSAKRMAQLIEDVLLIGRGESGKQEFNPMRTDLASFCCELVTELQANAHDTHTLLFTYNGDFTDVFIDANLLYPVLNNLLLNAIKYSPSGSTVRLSLSHREDSIVLKVQDAGIGIPPSDLPHLFELFHRAANVDKVPGTGLGLAIVKQCVEQHGGTISVESTVGAGTTFTVELPNFTPNS